jgi:TrbL/VirB6 plasmid conjugal transfer protein
MDWPQLAQALLEAIGRLEAVLFPLVHPEKVVAALLDDSLGLLLKVWFGFILRTTDFETGRDFTANVTIHRFEPSVQVVADACLVLVVVWASYRLMWGAGVKNQYAARLMLPRLLMGTLLINFALPLFQVVVQASNVACDAIRSFGTIPDWKAWWTNFSLDQTSGVWQIITTGALVVGYDILAVTYLVRYAILIVLAITAPLAGLLYTLPDTHHLAKQWTSIFFANLLMQPVQLFVLAVGFALENGGHTLVHHLFALASLLIVFKVPGALGSAEKAAHKLESALTAGLKSLHHLATHAA